MTAIFLITEIGEVESKIPYKSGLVTTTVVNATIGEVRNNREQNS